MMAGMDPKSIAVRILGILTITALAFVSAACQERPEFIVSEGADGTGGIVVADPPLYDYAPWPDLPTPEPWPEGVIPFTRHIASPEGAPVLEVDTEPLYQSFQYTLREVHVETGDTVTLSFKARREYHTFTIDRLGIDEVITPGQTNSFSYTFHVPGNFEFYCIPHPYMTGVVTVTAAE